MTQDREWQREEVGLATLRCAAKTLLQLAATLRQARPHGGEVGVDISTVSSDPVQTRELSFEVEHRTQARSFFAEMMERSMEQIVHFFLGMFGFRDLLDETAAITCQQHGIVIAP